MALKWALVEADSAKALRLRAEFLRQIHELVSPDVFPIEVAHALAKTERRGIIQQGEGEQFLMDVLSTPPDLYPYLRYCLELLRWHRQRESACTIASTLLSPSKRTANC